MSYNVDPILGLPTTESTEGMSGILSDLFSQASDFASDWLRLDLMKKYADTGYMVGNDGNLYPVGSAVPNQSGAVVNSPTVTLFGRTMSTGAFYAGAAVVGVVTYFMFKK